MIKKHIVSLFLAALIGQNSYAVDSAENEIKQQDLKPLIIQFSNPTEETQQMVIKRTDCDQMHLLELSPHGQEGSVQMIYGADADGLAYVRRDQGGGMCSSIINRMLPLPMVFTYPVKGLILQMTSATSIFDHPFFKDTLEKFQIVRSDEKTSVFNQLCLQDIKYNHILKTLISLLDLKTLKDIPIFKTA